MGNIIKVRCPKCTLYNELKLGQGMNDYSIENIITYFPEDTAKEVEQLHQENKIKSFEFTRYPGICPICKQLEEAPVLEITLHSGKKIAYGTTCMECKANLMVIYDNLSQNALTCPDCGKAQLEVSQIGYWD